jgi:hypothetical protein
MELFTNITDDTIQTFTLIVGDETAVITLRFYPMIQMWMFDLTFRDINIKGIKISLGVLHMNSYNFPFDFIAADTSGNGLSPFDVNDFESGRIQFFRLTAEEIEDFRGYSVKV